MSEFQYYQFQSIDRRLTKEDREYLKTKSSRVKLETHGARFTYSSGDFRGNPLEVLDRCFDMMSYIANFGDRQIAFRFPKNALDLEVLQPYAIPYCIEFKTTQKSTIVNIALSAEDFYGGWIDEKHDG
ncbi:MAG: hypothetical protein J7641_11075, partial [Cyanobacteria bacterium SID2]|nr:hypothetical protein [Cyanobacteria bacterium SID2]